MQRFDPTLVYECQSKTDVVALPPQDPPNPAPDLDLVPPFRHSTRITRCPNRCGLSHTSLIAILSFVAIPSSYSYVVKHEC